MWTMKNSSKSISSFSRMASSFWIFSMDGPLCIAQPCRMAERIAVLGRAFIDPKRGRIDLQTPWRAVECVEWSELVDATSTVVARLEGDNHALRAIALADIVNYEIRIPDATVRLPKDRNPGSGPSGS